MSRLSAARTGLAVGFAIVTPIVVWLGGHVLGSSSVRSDAHARIAEAVDVLWIAQTMAVVLAAPRGIDADWIGRVVGASVLIAVALPLLAVFWLAEAATGKALLRGLALSLACAALAVALAGMVERGLAQIDVQRLALATIELGLATALWVSRGAWLAWVRG